MRKIIVILIITLLSNSVVFANNDSEYTDEEIIESCRVQLQEILDKDEFDLFGKKAGKIIDFHAKLFGVDGKSPIRSLKWDMALADMQLKVMGKTLADNGYFYVALAGLFMFAYLSPDIVAYNTKIVPQHNQAMNEALAKDLGLGKAVPRSMTQMNKMYPYKSKITLNSLLTDTDPKVTNKMIKELPNFAKQYNKVFPIKPPTDARVKKGTLNIIEKIIKRILNIF